MIATISCFCNTVAKQCEFIFLERWNRNIMEFKKKLRDLLTENSLSPEQLSKKLPKPVGRKYTLNFAVTKDTILDADRLSSLFDKDDFIVKITPIHETHSAIENGYDVTTSYDDYDVYRKFEQPLVKAGWDVIVFVPSKEEDSDRITCGNALISNSSLN